MVQRRRHLAKAISYRILGSSVTAIVGWAYTGSIQLGLMLSAVDATVKIVGYYFHERIWYKIRWGIKN